VAYDTRPHEWSLRRKKNDGNKKTLEEKLNLWKKYQFLQVLIFVMYDVTTTSDN
jgi:ATP-dependent RNA circularization protein (DNA/RNA ligase family)